MKKRLLSVALIATMLCTLFVVPAFAKDFPDTAGHWAQNAISVWSDRGVVNGDDAGNFRPGDPITRAETAKMIDNLIGFEKTSNKVFSDVGVNDWYALSVSKLYAAGVLTGYEDGTIRPGARISRQEAAVIIGRAFDLDTTNVDQSLLAGFSDNDQIQDWARPTIAYMAGLLFVQGSDGMFRPGDPITRAEMVTILNNMVGVYADGSKDYYNGNYGDKLAIIKAPTTFDGVVLGGAVICPAVEGSVNFNSNSYINGRLCVLSPDAVVGVIGATVASTSNKYGAMINSSSYSSGYNNSYNSTPSLGGGGGASGGGAGSTTSGSTKKYTVAFYGNGGAWKNGETMVTVRCTSGKTYALHQPLNPSRTGYSFKGWYVSEDAANNLTESKKLQTTDVVSSASPKELYAGWQKNSGRYGTVKVATGENVAGRGKSAAELMDSVVLTENTLSDGYTATGGLRYVTGPWDFPNLNAEGNFLALTYTLPTNIANPEAAILKTGFNDGTFETPYEDFTEENLSHTRVFEIGASDLTKDIVFTVDLDGTNTSTHTLTVDLSGLVRYRSQTVTTLEEFKTALADNSVERITVDAPLTLTDGTYGSADTRKKVVLNHGFLIDKDATVTLQQMDITADGTMAAMIANATEIPEGETEPVATKAASLTLSDLSVTTGGMDSVLNELKTQNLTVKNCFFSHNTEDACCAITLGTLAEGDTVVLEHNTFDSYTVALEYKDITALNTGENILEKTTFLNNTTDIKLNASDVIPNIAYNYFDEAPVIAGPADAITNYYGPLYTDTTLGDSSLSENTHDAYVFVDGVLKGKFSAIDSLSLTFTAEETPCEIVIAPVDIRDTAVSINETEGTTASLLKADLPAELTIQVGDGPAKTIAVSELVAE